MMWFERETELSLNPDFCTINGGCIASSVGNMIGKRPEPLPSVTDCDVYVKLFETCPLKRGRVVTNNRC